MTFVSKYVVGADRTKCVHSYRFYIYGINLIVYISIQGIFKYKSKPVDLLKPCFFRIN